MTQNSINNSSSDFTIDPGASGDSYIQYNINGTGKYRVGVDDDDGDSYKISQGIALGINDALVITANGERTLPLQPAFSAKVPSNMFNVTGDGTAYTIAFSTEFFDQNADYDNTTYTFTAPVTGKYQFNITVQARDLVASTNTGFIRLVTTARTYVAAVSDYATSGGANSYTASFLADMSASDTALVQIVISGGSKTVGVNTNSYFSGFLAC